MGRDGGARRRERRYACLGEFERNVLNIPLNGGVEGFSPITGLFIDVIYVFSIWNQMEERYY